MIQPWILLLLNVHRGTSSSSLFLFFLQQHWYELAHAQLMQTCVFLFRGYAPNQLHYQHQTKPNISLTALKEAGTATICNKWCQLLPRLRFTKFHILVKHNQWKSRVGSPHQNLQIVPKNLKSWDTSFPLHDYLKMNNDTHTHTPCLLPWLWGKLD